LTYPSRRTFISTTFAPRLSVHCGGDRRANGVRRLSDGIGVKVGVARRRRRRRVAEQLADHGQPKAGTCADGRE